MSMKRLMIAAVAALILSLPGYAVFAEPVTQTGLTSADRTSLVNSQSTFTLIKGGHSGGHSGAHGSWSGHSMTMHGVRGERRLGHRRFRHHRVFRNGRWWWYDDCDWREVCP
jgi:hypothetical protein